ncbi:MAG: hypothetical protein AAB845_03290 [Patescibacteria group bacterium]
MAHGKKKKVILNDRLDGLLRKILWLWLPFYAFFDLIQEAGHKKKH